MRRPRARGTSLLTLGLAITVAGTAISCRRGDQPLGVPDSYLLFAPAVDDAGHARASHAGLPVIQSVPLDDARAVPLHKAFAVGFAAEMLRTDYLLKQFIRDGVWQGRRFAAAARAAAAEPTVLLLQREPATEPGVGLAVKGFFGAPSDRPAVPWIAVSDDPERDGALTQTVTARLARRIATTLASAGVDQPNAVPVSGDRVLIDAYAQAMEVIAREWRVGTGPQGAIAPDAGTEAQRSIFAAIRQNRFVTDEGSGKLRAPADMLKDAGVAATILYRMAQSKGVGSRIGPAELYAPFVTDRVPPGVSPAAVLGPFRNFQAKLIAAWGRAILRGAPPHDVADLVAAYAAELPAERAEVFRIFVVTTFGATVKPGGVSVATGAVADALPELTALAAEVAAGRRSLRAAVSN